MKAASLPFQAPQAAGGLFWGLPDTDRTYRSLKGGRAGVVGPVAVRRRALDAGKPLDGREIGPLHNLCKGIALDFHPQI